MLAAAGWQSWCRGKVWDSRLLTPIVPLSGMPLAAVIDSAYRVRSRHFIMTIILLEALGLGTQLITLPRDPVTGLDS